MSTFKVEICEIDTVIKHPNADSLDIITLKNKDWNVVTKLGLYSVGEKTIYFPVDSILSSNVEFVLFTNTSKIKLNNSRIRTIKIRGTISQGMVARPELFGMEKYPIGKDVTKELNITKYEPPTKLSPRSNPLSVTKKQINPYFRKYTSIENAKNYTNIFQDNEEVIITEKIHGTNFRCGYVPCHANTLWKKLKQFLGFASKTEFVYGSHNVQLQNKLFNKNYYSSTIGNVYAEAVIKYGLRGLPQNAVIYGEIYGDGIQKDYNYGCKQGERKLVLFDVMIDGKYLDPIAFKKWADTYNLPTVPILYQGPFNKQKILTLRDGNSILEPSQKIREGVVVKPLQEQTTFIGRKILKYISDAYLLKNQDNESEAH